MKRVILIVVIVLAGSIAWAGEKENLAKDIKIMELQKQNIELQMMILPETHGKIDKALKQAQARLKELEEKETKK